MKQEMTKIADYLLSRSSFIRDISLYHGKMGIAISLYMYSSQFGDEMLGEYAWELLQEVYDNIHEDMPVGIENGLAGIGLGTVILNHYGILECDLNDVLIDVDKKIMERDPRRMTDFTLRTGANGIRFYIEMRATSGAQVLTFDDQYIREIGAITSSRTNFPTTLLSMLNEPSFSVYDYINKPIGIDGGCAYYLFKSFLYD